MEWLIWAAMITAPLSFCFWVTFRVGRMRGFKDGARAVLVQWKATLNEEDNNIYTTRENINE